MITDTPTTASGTSTPRSTDASGYLLLTIPHAIVNQVQGDESMVLAKGEFRLECVSMPIPPQIGKQTANPFSPSPSDPPVPTHDFWLVVQIGATYEVALIPTQRMTPMPKHMQAEGIKYTMPSVMVPGAEIHLTLPLPASNAELEDLDSLEVLLRQYGCLAAEDTALAEVTATPLGSGPGAGEDNKGKLLLINQETGEVVGELEGGIDLQEDKQIQQGSQDKPVMLDFGDVVEGYAPVVVVKTVPEDEMDDWLLKGAHYISKGILTGGNFASKKIQSGADLFIRNTKAAERPVHLSNTTKAGVRVAHNATTKTVKVTKSTVGAINNALSKIVEKGYEKVGQPTVDFVRDAHEERRQSIEGLIPRRKSSTPQGGIQERKEIPMIIGNTVMPTSYNGNGIPYEARQRRASKPDFTDYSVSSPVSTETTGNPPPYKPPTGSPPPIPEKPHSLRANTAITPSTGEKTVPLSHVASAPATPSSPVNKAKRPFLNRLLLAGEVVLTSVEATVQELINSSTAAASSTAGHKFGPEAGHATELLGGSVRNVAVVYMDVRGIGRTALLKGTAQGFVKARLNNGEVVRLQGEGHALEIKGEKVEVEAGEVEKTKEGEIVVGMAEVQVHDEPQTISSDQALKKAQ